MTTFADILGTPRARKARLTSAQKIALAAYNECLRQEDRYFGSVFVNAAGSAAIEAKTKIAYDRCKSLGMTHEHGL
jgi:hypothetical protein